MITKIMIIVIIIIMIILIIKTSLIRKLTIKYYLQFISPRKHYLHYVQLKQYLLFLSIKKKKGHSISVVKIHSIKNILYIRKKNSIKKRFISTKLIYELTPLTHTLGY